MGEDAVNYAFGALRFCSGILAPRSGGFAASAPNSRVLQHMVFALNKNMPSVEIVCIGQPEPIVFENVPFRIDAKNKLRSQRTPSPLFQADFDVLSGCIYHLIKQSRGACTAYDLLDIWWEEIRFKPEYVADINHILTELLAASPEGKVLFTSDYQFGPKQRRYKRPITLGKFWVLHAEGKLWANALYPLKQDKPD